MRKVLHAEKKIKTLRKLHVTISLSKMIWLMSRSQVHVDLFANPECPHFEHQTVSRTNSNNSCCDFIECLQDLSWFQRSFLEVSLRFYGACFPWGGRACSDISRFHMLYTLCFKSFKTHLLVQAQESYALGAFYLIFYLCCLGFT